jgi:hypothetical protein
MGSVQLVVVVSVALCVVSVAIAWTTKSYIWPAVWSVLMLVVPGPAGVASLFVGLLTAYIARNRKAAATKEVS